MKLTSYLSIGWLSASLATRYENARALFAAVFTVAVVYSLYGILLSALGTSQFMLIEGIESPYGHAVSGGFVSKNSFASFTGMAFLAGLSLVVEAGQYQIVSTRGWRTHLRTLLEFAAGRGAPWLAGSLVLFSALVASNSRAGLIATLVGLLLMFVLSIIISHARRRSRWTVVGGVGAALSILALFMVNGQSLQSRFENLMETRGADELRPLMWDAATRAILDHPVTGLGLGTYGDAYNLYTDKFVPFVVDRAHNDFLELTMGIGIPAAIAWVLAFAVLTGLCCRGALMRHRRRIFPVTAVGATMLIGFHSLFDFSLQMPAVSVLYAVVMGVGLGQSRPTRDVA